MFPLFLLISIAGYTTFGDNVDSDILLNYPAGTFVTVARIGIIIDVLTSFPLMVFFTRTSMVNLLQDCGCCVKREKEEVVVVEEEEEEKEEVSSGKDFYYSYYYNYYNYYYCYTVITTICIL